MIGEALRLIRVFHNTKQTDMAKALDISSSYLSEIENGKKEPSLEILDNYAKEFKTSTSAILFFRDGLNDNSMKSKVKSKIRRKVIQLLQRLENAS